MERTATQECEQFVIEQLCDQGGNIFFLMHGYSVIFTFSILCSLLTVFPPNKFSPENICGAKVLISQPTSFAKQQTPSYLILLQSQAHFKRKVFVWQEKVNFHCTELKPAPLLSLLCETTAEGKLARCWDSCRLLGEEKSSQITNTHLPPGSPSIDTQSPAPGAGGPGLTG